MKSQYKYKILITGASGMIASEFIKRFESEFHFLALTKSKLTSNEFTQYINYNLEDFTFTENLITSFAPDYVLNTGFYLSSKSNLYDISQFISSIKLTNCILYCLEKSGTKVHWIELRSFSEFKFSKLKDPILHPSYLYSLYKTFSSKLLDFYFNNSKNISKTELIIFSVYGLKTNKPKIFEILFDSIIENKHIQLSSGNQELDFVHIDDVMEAILNNIVNKQSRIWVGSGITFTLRQVVQEIENITNLRNININWSSSNDRPNDVYFAKAPIQKNSSWKATVNIHFGIQSFYKKYYSNWNQ